MGAKAGVRGAAALAIIGTPGPDVLHGTAGDDEINGRDGDDTLYGEAGNDSLDGWGGADRMEGGAGDDIYFVDDAGDRVVEDISGVAGGVDLAHVAVDWTLGDNVENLWMHAYALAGTGNELDNVITGNNQNNRLTGLGGNDTVYGGGGDDTCIGWDGGGLLEFGEDIGDDGADRYYGGAGSDTYVVPNWSSQDGGWFEWWEVSPDVRADLRTGVVRYPGASIDRLDGVENIRTGVGNDVIRGADGANVIEVGGGTNQVKALGGDDTIIGGNSWQHFAADPAFVMERLDGGPGADLIDSGGSYWRYGTARSDDQGMTTDLLFGRAGNDRLIGGAGNIVMNGGSGADTFEARADAFEIHSYHMGTVDVLASTVVVRDFDGREGDRILLRTGISNVTIDYPPERADIPDFIGRSGRVDVDEVGFDRIQRDDGGRDTVLTYRYVYHTDLAINGDGYGLTRQLDFTIVLEDYAGRFPADWITLA